MDLLTNHLNDFWHDEKLSPMVRDTTKCGRKIMDKYYSRIDETIIFCIAMGAYFVYFLLHAYL